MKVKVKRQEERDRGRKRGTTEGMRKGRKGEEKFLPTAIFKSRCLCSVLDILHRVKSF